MDIVQINNCTRILGEAQGYIPLPLRDEIIHDLAAKQDQPAMLTLWRPTPDELVAMMNGAPIVLSVLGTRWPPLLMYVDPLEMEGPPAPGSMAEAQLKLKAQKEQAMKEAAESGQDNNQPVPADALMRATPDVKKEDPMDTLRKLTE